MGTCCSAGSRICQPFDPCQGVSWTVRGLLSNPSLLAATFLIRVRNLAETPSEVTTAAWPGQIHEKFTGETAAGSSASLRNTVITFAGSSQAGWRPWLTRQLGHYLAVPMITLLHLSLLAPVSIISGTILFTDFSQGTIYPRPSCLWDKENGNWISAFAPKSYCQLKIWMRNEARGISIQNIQFLFVLYDNINSLLATLFLWANRDGEKSPQQQPVALYGLFKKQLAKTDLVSIDRQETGPGILSDLIKGPIQSWIWAQAGHSSKHVISAMKERRELVGGLGGGHLVMFSYGKIRTFLGYQQSSLHRLLYWRV